MPDLEQEFAPAPKKKSNTAKILLGCGAVAIILMVVAGYFLYSFATSMTDPKKIHGIATSIAGPGVPAGFEGKVGMDLMGLELAVLQAEDGHLLALGRTEQAKSAVLESQLRSLIQGLVQAKGAGEIQGTEEFDVGGKAVKFDQKLYKSAQGSSLELSGQLPQSGNNVALVVYIGPENGFDVERFKAFVGSVKTGN